MARKVLHASWVRKNGFGGTTFGTQCNRMTSLDGMNIADDHAEVTCAFCRKMIDSGQLRPSLM